MGPKKRNTVSEFMKTFTTSRKKKNELKIMKSSDEDGDGSQLEPYSGHVYY